jgi:hypothetical protein
MRDAVPFVLLFVGGALLFYGGLPVWHALIVWDGMMHKGSIELHEMDDWDEWAFAPRFTISAATGAVLLVVAALGLVQSRWRHPRRNCKLDDDDDVQGRMLQEFWDWLTKDRY